MPEAERRGLKRKRNDDSESNLTTKLAGKLHHGLREVRKAAKKAKAFEMQKLVKKLKAVRAKGGEAKETAELEAQLEALKVIIHEPIADSAVKSKLKKDRVLAANEHVQAAIKSELSSNLLVPATSGSPASKVESRLLSSKILAAEVHSVIDALKNVIEPRPREALIDEPDHGMEEIEDELPLRTGKRSQQMIAGEHNDENSDEESQDSWESGSVHDLADDGWESGSVQGDGKAGGGDSSEDSSDEEEVQDESSDNEADASPRVPQSSLGKMAKDGVEVAFPTRDIKGKSKAVGESTFLPSLSVGFTRGDSDASDWSDEEVNKVERKNRRGQRARRAIWEKKYGKNANHVKKEHVQADAEARKGTKGFKKSRTGTLSTSRQGQGSSGSHTEFRAPPSDKGWSRNNTEPQAHVADKQADEKKLHPSWEAKRRLKEKLNPSIVPAAGTKIVF